MNKAQEFKRISGRLEKKRNLGKIIFGEIVGRESRQFLIESSSRTTFEIIKRMPLGTALSAIVTPEVETGNYILLEVIESHEPGGLPTPALNHLMNPAVKRNLLRRAAFVRALRESAHSLGFVEFETPILAAPTKEGAKLFEVSGTEYALPQSPQLYKQLLMIAGYEQYFQIARCFRAESARANRQPEFTQFCLEKSETTVEELITIGEKLISEAMSAIGVEMKPWLHYTHSQALREFGTAEPNLGMQGIVITEIPMFEESATGLKPTHHPFTRHESGAAMSFEFILMGQEVGGGSIRPSSHVEQLRILEEMGYSAEEAEREFGMLLGALKYGSLSHGGFAFGIERLLASASGEASIYNHIAFPKNGSGKGVETEGRENE